MDSVILAIFRSLYTSVAEEMGVALRRTAFSPNIKERRDYSCAVFDQHGRLVAQGDHMPVHLGSMPLSVAAALAHCPMQPGDVVMLNDPYTGGTHLPDITMVAPVFPIADCGLPIADFPDRSVTAGATTHQQKRLRKGMTAVRFASPKHQSAIRHPPSAMFYVANRAHHADIGGATAGSMGQATEIYQEGIRIPPVRIVRGGVREEALWELLLANVRGRAEREGDFAAQLGSLRVGAERLHEIVARYGFAEADAYAGHLVNYAARLMRRTLAQLPDGVYHAEDFLDDDGETAQPIRIAVNITIRGEAATIDFSGSAAQARGPINAVASIAVSAVYYVFRCLVGAEVPASAGILAPLTIITPAGTVVNALPPAPVAGGNVETSQRITDVIFKALSQAAPHCIPAASQGTMNNLTIGGWDATRGAEFAYYETIGGGMGARPNADGLSAVHTHMTNSLNTPVEALEYAYPLRVRRYAIRRGSGGMGEHKGGDGTVREVELLTDAQVSLLADRRTHAPYGLHGGAAGQSGNAQRLTLTSRGTLRKTTLPSKFTLIARAGERILIETPGGGGFGVAAPPGKATHSRKRTKKQTS